MSAQISGFLMVRLRLPQIGHSTVAASKFATLLLPSRRRPEPLALRLAISFLSSVLPWRHVDAGPAEVGLTD